MSKKNENDWSKDLTEDQVEKLKNNFTYLGGCDKWMQKAFKSMPSDLVRIRGYSECNGVTGFFNHHTHYLVSAYTFTEDRALMGCNCRFFCDCDFSQDEPINETTTKEKDEKIMNYYLGHRNTEDMVGAIKRDLCPTMEYMLERLGYCTWSEGVRSGMRWDDKKLQGLGFDGLVAIHSIGVKVDAVERLGVAIAQ